VGYLTSPVLALVALSIAAAGDYATRGPFWALPGKFVVGSAAAGAIALINSMGAVGGFFGPIIVADLKKATGGFFMPMVFLAGVLIVGAILTLFLRRTKLLRD
jgi:ACS family tartrate transporter-like MFS transporter